MFQLTLTRLILASAVSAFSTTIYYFSETGRQQLSLKNNSSTGRSSSTDGTDVSAMVVAEQQTHQQLASFLATPHIVNNIFRSLLY